MLKQVQHDGRGQHNTSCKSIEEESGGFGGPFFYTLPRRSSSPIHNISATLCACLCAVPSKRLGGADKII
jgi:hypothetical protein